jgi:hypothetical protein
MGIKMNVQSRHNGVEMMVLVTGELFLQVSLMVIVYEGQRPHRIDISFLKFILNQMITDHVADGFRTVRVPLRDTKFIESV